jgi:hypothetical protein
MDKVTYAEYLQENLGNLPIQECLDVIGKAEKGEMTDFEVEQELAPVVGTILSELFNNDRETFEYLLGKVAEAAETIRAMENDVNFCICPVDDGVDMLAKFESILNQIRDGFALAEHWLDQDGQLMIVLTKPQAK